MPRHADTRWRWCNTRRAWAIEKLAEVAKPPLHIPLRLGLLNSRGEELKLKLAGGEAYPADATSLVLSLINIKHEFVFEDIDEAPVPSLLRDFSAPVIVDYDYRDDELALLAAKDSDPFQSLGRRCNVLRVARHLRPGAAT